MSRPTAAVIRFGAGIALIALIAFTAGCGSSGAESDSKNTPGNNTIIPENAEPSKPVPFESTDFIGSTRAVTGTISYAPAKPALSDYIYVRVDVQYNDALETGIPDTGDAFAEFILRPPVYTANLPADPDSGAEHKRFEFKLEPSDAGALLLRPMIFHFRPDKSGPTGNPPSGSVSLSGTSAALSQLPIIVMTPPIEITVSTTLKPGTVDLAKLEPLEKPVQPPADYSTLFIVLIIAGILLAVALAAGAYVIRRRHDQPVEPEIPPDEEARIALENLLASELITRECFSEFFLELTRIVRRYIERTTGVNAPELTTEEFLQKIKRLDLYAGDQKERLKEFLETSDLIKFAKEIPDDTLIDQSVRRARVFVGLDGQPAGVSGESLG